MRLRYASNRRRRAGRCRACDGERVRVRVCVASRPVVVVKPRRARVYHQHNMHTHTHTVTRAPTSYHQSAVVSSERTNELTNEASGVANAIGTSSTRMADKHGRRRRLNECVRWLLAER